jgi:hypothetical protein
MTKAEQKAQAAIIRKLEELERRIKALEQEREAR